jgi:biopolymer transport protein ExbD
LPENDFSHAKGHFLGINPGAYNLQCELELPGFSATGEGGKQLTPAAGEWTGKLTTRGVNVEVIAPDAPAPKPPVESVVVAISKDGEISLDRKKMPLDELKTLAARNAKKWFTIQADEDVPYVKVIAVIEALKASGVTQFSFATSRQEILSAEPVEKPRTDSTASKSNNPDDSAPPIQTQAEQDGEQPIKTVPVIGKELHGIWYGATDRTGVVVRFIGRESRIKNTRGVVSGEWVVHVVDGSIGATLEFTDDPKAGVVRITAGMWNDKAKEAFTMSLGTIERGEDDTLYLTINDNPKEPMYLQAKRIPLTFIEDRDEIQRSDIEKMQARMQSLKPR